MLQFEQTINTMSPADPKRHSLLKEMEFLASINYGQYPYVPDVAAMNWARRMLHADQRRQVAQSQAMHQAEMRRHAMHPADQRSLAMQRR